MSISFWIFCLCSSHVVTNLIILAWTILCVVVIWAIQTQTWLTTFVVDVSTPTYQLLSPSNFTSTTSNFNFAHANHSHKSSSLVIEQRNQTKFTNYGASHQQQTPTLNSIICLQGHSCLNNAHNIDVQTIQVDEWHSCLFHMNLWKSNFAQLLLPNHDLWSLWWSIIWCDYIW
jgi:hypothetical protein